MAWPTPQDYNEAVQNPRQSFTDPELQAGQPELNKIGLPRPIAGGFACVYKIQSGSSLWAARCFLSEVTDQQQRYEAISKHLAVAKLVQTVPFTYLAGGIKVQGRAYPLVKMRWVQGESLSAFVGRSIGDSGTLLSLAKVWSHLLAELKTTGIAHGDLQHGNVVVVGDQLRLLDYDGMFVPGLGGKQSNELGHRNYQLPSRSRWDYGPHLDNFSAWVIYVSFVVLAVHPELWAKHRGGDECLIFRKEDFQNPDDSEVLRDLNSSPNAQLRILVELFVSLFSLSPEDVPSLDGNLAKITVAQPSVTSHPSRWWSDHVEPAQQDSENPNRNTETLESVSSVADPGWILDVLMEEKPVDPIKFQGKVRELQIIIAGTMGLTILTNFLGNIPASQVVFLTFWAFGLNLLLCYVRFKRDPSQAEFETFKAESKAFSRRVKEHQVLIDSISAERLAFRQKADAIEREIVGQKDRWTTYLQKEQNSAQADLDSHLKVVNQRRRELSSSETNKLNSINGTLGNQISELDRKIAGLNQQEVDEKNKVLAALLDSHVQNYLRRHAVSSSWIPGIGATYKSRLAYGGFATAADIDWSVSRISGIGPARQTALIRWRQGLEQEARQSAPQLSPQDRVTIENKYRHARVSFEAAKQQLKTQFNSQVASGLKQYFADARQAFTEEEQQLRSACVQRKNQVQKDHNTEVANLDQKLNTAKNQAAPTMNELHQKLQQAQKQIFGLRWQAAKQEKEGRRFASLRFSKYMRKIITS